MIVLLTTFVMGMAAAECDDTWGQINEADVVDGVIAGGEDVELHVLGANDEDCDEEVDDCDWTWIDQRGQPLGSLTDCDGGAPEGSPVCYTPPNTLDTAPYECQDQLVEISVDCTGASRDSLVITVRDTSAECQLDYSVSGGGCISPQSSVAWVLFPLFGLGGAVRRRRS